MSDYFPIDLRNFLDQALADVPARDARIMRMREELTAHLLDVFTEELERHHDEPTAIAATIQRFGGNAAYDEFRACVPLRERLFFHLLGRKEHFMWRFFLILGVVGILVGAGFICPALAQLLEHGQTVSLLLLGAFMAVGGLWSAVHGVNRFRMRNS